MTSIEKSEHGMNDPSKVKEIFVTSSVSEVLDRLKKGWLLHEVNSHQDKYLFLMFRL